VTLDELKNVYLEDRKSHQLADLLSHDQAKTVVKGSVGSSTAFIAAAVIEQNEGDHLFVLRDKEDAAYFLNDLEVLLPNRKLFFFPRSARVPYQTESTENANIAMRAEVLNELTKHKGNVITISFPEALSEVVVTKKKLVDNTFDVHLGESYSMEFIDELMQTYHFEKVDYVYEPGHYSIRGGIVDIFSFSFEQPYRFEFSVTKWIPFGSLTHHPSYQPGRWCAPPLSRMLVSKCCTKHKNRFSNLLILRQPYGLGTLPIANKS